MGERLFGRNARVVFKPPGATEGIEVTGLRIKFKVEKTIEPTPNKAQISVWNMNEGNRSLAESKPLEKSSGDGGVVQVPGVIFLDCGYGEKASNLIQSTLSIQRSFENVFVGDIMRALSRYEGADIITDFESADGEVAFKDKRADMSFSPGANYQDIFKAMSEKMGLQIGSLSAVKSKSALNGYTVSGPIRNILDTLTKTQGLEWSIQDGKLQFIRAGGSTQQEAVLLSPETGLVGSPTKKDQGLEVKSLLQPKLIPGRLVAIESKFIKGNIFRVVKVTHEGDTHDSAWYSTCEVEEVQ